ncbi:hypothetical protein HOY80DRAFT_1028531 [Tuber brumale]|nr:hypothetical protein HOY80DRAFT_1028531 [Tuber brumale]
MCQTGPKSGGPELLGFANLTPKDSTLILENLSDAINHFEERRFRVHFSAPGCHLRVGTHGLIEDDADEAVDMPSSPRVTNFIGQFAGSVKAPDFSFVPVDPN